MELTRLQLQDFHRDGYLVIPGAVPGVMVDAARAAINHSLGYDGLPPEDLPKMRATTYCGDLRSQPVIADLMNRTPIFPLLESMMGPGQVEEAGGAQIALRFSGHGKQDSRTFKGHLDGVGTGINGTPKGEYRRGFTALATVLLSDLPGPFHGNFTVWPGSHHTAEAFFREATPDVLKQGSPEYALPREPVQITGRAGDVCISHHMIWHTAAPNHGPNIRYAAIFRARHVDVNANGVETMTDIWREFPGVREAVEEPCAALN